MKRLSSRVPVRSLIHLRPQKGLVRWCGISCAFVALLLAHTELRGQAFPIFNGAVNTCTGAFLDSGGEGAVGYSNNEDFTYTICPDSPNDAVSLTFLTFNLSNAGAAPNDRMTIYDGSSTAATTLGTYVGTALQGITVNASPLNSTGCLTIVFHSNETGTGVFAASISCYTPCQRPVAAATMSEADPVKICAGESITFNSSTSTAAPGFSIASRRWDFGDGTVVNNAPVSTTHTYAQEGGYTAQLYLVDNNGCASANRTDLLVMVGTEPDFIGTSGNLLGCAGETLCLDGVVNATTWNELPSGDLGGGVFLPDDVGSCFESELIFSQFGPGQTLTDVNDLLSICVNMEHSFMGDLVINIISPTGQSVTMHQQGGGATFLGVPVDNDATPDVQGECWNYCWSPTATTGTWVDNAGATLATGTYESLNDLNGLLGSQLNGIWRLQICDLWGSDNGFECSWDIDFDPDLYPDLLEFTPIYGADCDSSYWSGPNITSTTADCDGICLTPPSPGTYNYVYTVKDDFGCTYDTTLVVTIVAPPAVNAGNDVTTCGTPVQLSATASGGLPGACSYSLRLIDTFGDGWDGGAQITVNVDGVASTYALEDPPGDQVDITIPVLHGDAITLTYQAGTIWNGENRFVLRNAAGTVLFNSGVGPASGIAWSGAADCPPEPFIFTWSPTTGLSSSTVSNPTANVSGTTVYCVTAGQPSHPNCTATDCVTITVDTGVDPGTNGTITVCENTAAFDLFAQLGGTPTSGGTWTAPGGGAHAASFLPGTDVAGVYTYQVTGSATCGGVPETATVTVVVNSLVDAGVNGAIALCSSDAPQALFSSLGGSAVSGGSWSGPSGSFNGTFDPAVDPPSAYTYTVNGTAPCPSASAVITVSVSIPVDAGTDAVMLLCSSDAPASLFAQLGGTPDAGGTWTGPSAVVGGMIDPATMSAGVYTYTVAGTAPCPDESATVTVTINTPPEPGTNGAITLCSSDAPASLFAQLGGTPDAGGTWTGPSAVVGGLIDPATMSAGIYTYTVAGTAPCPDQNATVTVTINTPPEPGTNGAITLCSSDAPASLFAQLGGTPDAGGTWTGPSAVVGGLIDPATMSAGIYTYTVAGTAPCPDENATVTVTINTPPEPGTNGAITLCSSDAPASLFAQLGGTPDAGGTWTGPSAVVGGLIDPATMSAGVYTYTVAGTAPCPDESATVTVMINTPPDAGDDAALALCATSPALSLFDALGGTPNLGGTWDGPSPVIANMFDPATMNVGEYTYMVQGALPCISATATVAVSVVTNPDAGTPGAITACTSAATMDLFDALGGTPDAGGTWSGPAPIDNGQFIPSTMTAGVYTYTIDVPAPCVSVNSTVTVTLVQPPDAGIDGSLTLCISSAPAALFPQLGGDPDGSGAWSGPSPVVGGMFNPASMANGTYNYTVAGTAPCPSDMSTVDVNVVAAPDAGTPGTISVCASNAAFDLFAELNGTPDAGGAWSGPSAVIGGSFDPATMNAGIYTYTISVPPPCVNASNTVTVTVVQPPNAGADGSLTLCISSPVAELITALAGTPDTGGTWSGPSTVNGGSFDPSEMSVGTYTYTVNGQAPCPAAGASVMVDVVDAPNAGTPGSVALCSTDDAVDLFALLGGAPDAGGSWSGPSSISGGQFDPATMPGGIYTYTISVPPPCVNASSTVTVTVAEPPNAGSDGGLTLCATSVAQALVTGLTSTPDAGGTWSGPSPVSGGLFNPATMSMGIYTYTVAGISPCPATSAQVEVNVVDNPDPGGPGSITLCATDEAVDMFTWIEGTPDAGGTWSGPSAVVGGLFDPAVDVPGVYTYTLTVPPPCTSASTTVTVAVTAPPNAGDDGAITLCITSNDVPLFPVLGGSPDVGGTWAHSSGTAFTGDFAPASDTPGAYTYTVAGVSPCPADAATVVVNVVTDPDPGLDGALTLCSIDAPSELFSSLGGTPDIGGTWSAPDGTAFSGTFDPATSLPGVYTYTIEAPAPCNNVSSTVTVHVVQPADAGDDGVLIVCATGGSVDLFGSLQGQPDAGGSWTFNNSAFSGTFDPSAAFGGTYTYTVPGTTPCPNDAAHVQVSITQDPNAGQDAILNLCITGDPVDVFPSLGGADAGGTWISPDASTFTGIFTPGTTAPGDYTYQVTGTAPCPNASATVTITQLSDPDAGENGAITLCSSNAPIALFELLGGTPDPGGTWLDASGQVVGDQFDPSAQYAGTLTYLLTVPPPCVNDTSLVVVTIVQASDAGEDATTASCADGGAIDLFATLNGEPDAGGTWSGPSGLTNAMFVPGSSEAGTYSYTVVGIAPCPNVSADVIVAVEELPDAGEDGGTTVCPEAPLVDLFGLLGGTPDTNGTWTAPDGSSNDGTFDPAADEPGPYTYTVAGSLCPDDQTSSTVTIYAVPAPNAGPDAITCGLKYMLSATGSWASGTWSGPAGAVFGDIQAAETEVSVQGGGWYTFVWSTISTAGCASADEVSILFTKPVEAVATTTDAICNGSCDGTASVSATGGNIGDYFYIWSDGVAGNVPNAIGLCAGAYTVIVADTNGCNMNVPFIIEEPVPLLIDDLIATPETCPGSCDGTITVVNPEGVWFIIQGSSQTSPIFSGLCAGEHHFIMGDADGCTASGTAIVLSPPPVVAGFTFSPDTILISDPAVHFVNTSSVNAVSFAWNFGNAGTSTEENPAFVFPDGQADIYEVCLTARDANGCPHQVCLPLPIYDVLLVHVPNAFSPNGDGHNDEFLPVFNLPQVKDYQFMVFNRWGERIFGTDLPGKPWDGGYSGVRSQVDVYVWKLTCKDALSGEPIERVGHVTIVQ
ncbi:MAG: gliding motility-associated C-terminal domain-containing protein [Flavobacteriales bacterium]|nr:gliding motility-associated C-terminal domain-containing protein [Flavobacteriales bacterium]